MSTLSYPVSDLLLIAKSRELQRADLAEAQHDAAAARRHFLAGAYMELVLAEDFRAAGDTEMPFICHLSAASSLWCGGRPAEAQEQFQALFHDYPDRTAEIQEALDELNRDYPPTTTTPPAALPANGASVSSPKAPAPVA